MRDMETLILNLPEEIMSDILRRLPVDLLLTFRSVCKQWHFLLSENLCTILTKVLFTIDDSSSTSDDSSCTSDDSSCTSDNPSHTIRYCSLNSLLSEANLDPDGFKLPVSEFCEIEKDLLYEDVRIVGCFKGLICFLVNRSCLYIRYTSTGRIKMLPDVIGSSSYAIWRYGFGYDESDEDYKICVLFQHSSMTLRKYMRVFSMRYGYWKHIKIHFWEDINKFFGLQDEEMMPPMRHAGKLLKGKLHWGIEHFRSIPVIVSFDLTRETWKHINLPLYPGGRFSNAVEIISGQLCILCDIPRSRADIWIMKQYRVKKYWERMFKIPYNHDCKGPYLTPPFCILPDCRILLLRGSIVTIYDPKDKSMQYTELRLFGHIVEAEIYIGDSTKKFGAQEDEEKKATWLVNEETTNILLDDPSFCLASCFLYAEDTFSQFH